MLRFLIPYAYEVAFYQIEGAPSWVDSHKYDIIARPPEGSSEYQVRLMLQQLLTDRFGLKFHRERKEITGYAFVLAKVGPKLSIEKKSDEPGPDDGRIGAGRGGARGHMVSSAVFAQTLSLYLERPVIDQTGIDGLCNFELHWTPDETEPLLGGVPPLPNATPSTDPAGPSLLTALEEQTRTEVGQAEIGNRYVGLSIVCGKCRPRTRARFVQTKTSSGFAHLIIPSQNTETTARASRL
jgi:uncharacterized protein (TIGR03435 family)